MQEVLPLQKVSPHSAAGSVLTATVVHVPSAPDTLHASHVPLHAPSQHVPSTQKPDVHALAAPQLAAFAFFAAQVPLAQ